MKNLRILLLVSAAVVMLVSTGCGGTPEPTGTPRPTSTPAPTTWLTLDGYDSASNTTIQTINLWKDYNNRGAGIAGTGRHGQQVKLVRRSGDGVLIELTDGTRGWVTYYFIKEYK